MVHGRSRTILCSFWCTFFIRQKEKVWGRASISSASRQSSLFLHGHAHYAVRETEKVVAVRWLAPEEYVLRKKVQEQLCCCPTHGPALAPKGFSAVWPSICVLLVCVMGIRKEGEKSQTREKDQEQLQAPTASSPSIHSWR